MTADISRQPFLYMAPLKGITDALFRRIYHKHFTGVDAAIAPFINPHHKAAISDKLLKDVLPADNCKLPLIPQLLITKGDDFLALANRLHDLGYPEVNWNLGCPVPMVAKKRRGSGLLPYPDEIIELLDLVLPRLKPRLSIKMRLGFTKYHESLALLPRLDDYPLSEIIIHARLAQQLYRGTTAPERFEDCCKASRHTLVYNGDIISCQVYSELAVRFPKIERWMIGRGLLANPFLPAQIKGVEISEEIRQKTLASFHDELFMAMKERLSGPGHLLGRMKQIWIYLIGSFPGQEKLLKKITRASTEKKYNEAVQAIFSE